jgi:hypothetical protein
MWRWVALGDRIVLEMTEVAGAALTRREKLERFLIWAIVVLGLGLGGLAIDLVEPFS